MKTIAFVAGAALLLFVVFTVIVTARYDAPHLPVEPAPVVIVPDRAAQRLAGALRIRTISSEDPSAFDAAVFGALHGYLQAVFPRVHAQLQRETVGRHSLLYTWTGSDPSLKPILLLGHLDVVPVEPGTELQWQHDPFGGEISEGFIWVAVPLITSRPFSARSKP